MPRVTIRSMFDTLFHPKQMKQTSAYFQTLSGYTPVFTSWNGAIYEQELTRSAIQAGAAHFSKLKPEIEGSAKRTATKSLTNGRPNPWQTTSQFLARTYTMLMVDGTVFVVPVTADDEETITGYMPVRPSTVETYEVDGSLWLLLKFLDGNEQLIEWSRVGVLTRHQFEHDLFGSTTEPLAPTLDLIHKQAEAEKQAMFNGAAVRFLGRIGTNLRPQDVEAKRAEFNKNLGASNAGGIAVYDTTFADVKQVTPGHYTIDAEQMRRIEKAVYRFYQTNEDVILSQFTEETWGAYYESVIEPIALQLAEVLTAMTFTPLEVASGNRISFSANRLEYSTAKTKLSVATALFDRGVWSGNDVADVFQSEHYDGGDKHVIRGEYIDLSLIGEHTLESAGAALEANSNIKDEIEDDDDET